ncbi:redoxin [Sulfurifustis variabilis]|uniref:Redoxin n=1 Tax=Sulfurifustis variabilis TaxID=1675686 RepID=A0A1B4V806_9GAMM|nr:TlpA disulfide reductase family protein [Sulfurifustis variabilis]BAU49663.1 redoxin [Sulfurifustis variabilis]
MKRMVLASVVLLAAFALGLTVYSYSRSARDVPSGLALADASAARKSGFPLRLHATPRAVPDIRFQDDAGRQMSLADFRGRVVLLNLWATWCPPCRKEIPSLDRLQTKVGGPDFEVVALSIDHDGVSAVQRFYKEIGIRALKIYIDPTTDATYRLGITGIPGTLLLDREGREIGRALGPAEWDSPESLALIRRAIGGGPSAAERAKRE